MLLSKESYQGRRETKSIYPNCRLNIRKGVLDVSPINPAKLQKQLEQKALQEKKSREEAIANIQKIHKLIEESEKSGIDVTDFREGLKGVQGHMREREFSEAAEKSREVIENINRSLSSLLKERMESARALQEKARSLGMDATSLEEAIKSAESLEKEGEFFRSIEVLRSGVESVNAHLSDAASSVLESTENLINALKGTVDVSEPESLLKDARKKIEEGDTEGALDLSVRGRRTWFRGLQRMPRNP